MTFSFFFLLVTHYNYDVWCDVVQMDGGHLVDLINAL